MSVDVSLCVGPRTGPCPTCGATAQPVYTASLAAPCYLLADIVGLYDLLVYPDAQGITTARALTPLLAAGLVRLRRVLVTVSLGSLGIAPTTADRLVRFVENYGDACERFPEAWIAVE